MTTALATKKPLNKFEFDELHVHEGPHAYITSNEEPLLWKELFKDLALDRAAGICSSGEVGIFSLLPSVKRELVLVDHSNKSIALAMLKALMIREKGWEETRRLLTNTEYAELEAVLKELKKHLPEAVQKAFNGLPTTNYVGGGEGHFYTNRGTYDYKTSSYDKTLVTNNELVNTWKSFPTTCSEAESRLSKVRFIHGDLSDLANQGPFDLFYISNAMDHTGRDRKQPLRDAITKVVKPGGYIAAAEHQRGIYSGSLLAPKIPQDWEVVTILEGTKGMIWKHILYRTAT